MIFPDFFINDFQELLRVCNIGDVYLGSIWYAVNFHGKKQAKSESGEVIEHDADKNSLSRYEFIEVLFRLAEEIFLKSKDIKIKRRQHRGAVGRYRLPILSASQRAQRIRAEVVVRVHLAAGVDARSAAAERRAVWAGGAVLAAT